MDFTIGSVEDVSLGNARKKAAEVRDEAKTARPGLDPQAEKVRARARVDVTFGVLADRCMAALSLRPNTERQWKGIIKNHLIPKFGNMGPGAIERKTIREFIRTLGQNKPVLAARAFEVMRRVFSWGVAEEEIHGSPFVGLKKPERVMAADSRERERTLNRAEIHSIFQALQDPRFSSNGFDLYIRLLFETAVRRDEMLKATWSEVDFAAGFFTVGQLRYKSKRPHQVPLTKSAVTALKALKGRAGERAALAAIRGRLQDANADDRPGLEVKEAILVTRIPKAEASDYVFPGPNAANPRVSPQRAFEDLRRRAGFVDWTLHDIRRTVATELDRLGVAPQIREAILGHAPDKLTRTYSRHVPLLEMKKALESWSERLDALIKEAPSIHSFPEKAASE